MIKDNIKIAPDSCNMSDTISPIPVVDLDRIGLHRKPEEIDKEALETVSVLLKTTFCQFGVCYFKNHGIGEDFMDKYMAISKGFFNHPVEVKSQYLRGTRRDFGYTPMEKETVNFDRPADLKEAFTYQPAYDPDDLLDKKFQNVCKEMYALCTTLGYRVLDALSLALGQRQTFLRDCHKCIATTTNGTTLKTLNYPLNPATNAIKPGQVRLGEHSDFGTLTFLFQDDVGSGDQLSRQGIHTCNSYTWNYCGTCRRLTSALDR
ncbi:uncharacterized protein LOC123561062 [Mercenaria mercenaria]|uniref:uncharacterized protein LOC123561062 n=1 Tax=Mercenaria mercenaria TaxID=6596 RepID=UPI00234E8CB5|nr:uncharacterized protein LOC123561062 [Mercenaria mercenaria]